MNNEFKNMDNDEFRTTLGKGLSFVKTFTSDQTFEALYTAEEWLKQRGYSVGRMCFPEPIGVAKGQFDIVKWKHLDDEDKRCLDGVIVGDMRHGPVTVLLSGDVDDE